MTTTRTVVLDSEAVQALTSPRHRKHRRVLAAVEAVTARNRRSAGSTRLVVPTAVRVEAGWDRSSRGAAAVNRLRAADGALDARTADRAARLRTALGISVADAHVAAMLATTTPPHAVVTSDDDDLRRIAAHLGIDVHVVVV